MEGKPKKIVRAIRQEVKKEEDNARRTGVENQNSSCYCSSHHDASH